MCGITGIYQAQGNPDPALIQAMTDQLLHRGPDAGGTLSVTSALLFGHRRLSIIDLSTAGLQPMQTADGLVTVTYNGELYNYQELKKCLIAKGYTFRSQSDTEVLLYSYYEWREAAFEKFNGMFACAIWDARIQALYLVRDRFGIKPLYYYQKTHLLLFASEIKAFYVHPEFQQSVNKQGLSEYLWYGTGLGEATLFAGVKKLLPGHFLKITADTVDLSAYWSLPTKSSRRPVSSVKEAISITRRLLIDAIERQLCADVPVGVFLSGGIDSSAITAIASRAYSARLQTYAVGFDDADGVNELEKAAFVAKHFGTKHQTLHLDGATMQATLMKLVEAHDAPFADAANVPLYLLSEHIHGDLKVVLQGDGGDEVFAGYRRYHVLQYEKLWRIISTVSLPCLKFLPKHPIIDRYQRFCLALSKNRAAERMALLLTVDSDLQTPYGLLSSAWQARLQHSQPFSRYGTCAEKFSRLDPVQKMLYTDITILLADVFLEKVDKPTMAHSVEVRVPFLDTALTDFVFSLPAHYKIRHGQKKWLLRQALQGIVPDKILDAPKVGFGVPFGYWLRTGLADWMQSVLLDSSQTLFNHHILHKLIQAHLSRKQDHGFLLWKSLLLALWYRKHFQYTHGGSYVAAAAIA